MIGRIGPMIAAALSDAAPKAPSLAADIQREPATITLDTFVVRSTQPQILALGEASHGNEDVLRARNRLIRRLANQRLIRWVALETGYAEARLLDRFVRGGVGEAEDVAKHGFTSGFGAFSENAALLRDLRAVNLVRPKGDRIGIIGIDLSLGGPLDSAPTMAPVRCALEAVTNPARREALRTAFEEAVKPGLATIAVTGEQKAGFHALARRLQAVLPPTASREAQTCARIVEQSAAVFDSMPRVITPGSIPTDAWISISRRDKAMAANALDILRRSGGKSLLLFAHTSHVLKVPRRGGQWATQQRPPRSMGEFLHQHLGKLYFVLAQVERAPAKDASVPDLITTMKIHCAGPCVVPTTTQLEHSPAIVRVGINGNDEQLIDRSAADEFLFDPRGN
ncbi:erythromycin esterase family protein [Sphingomonas gellani]|nr:erythromycin esterase family protein [Sphingomonas gellani]